MPTGYTSGITKDMPLDTFVWTCARAFGALIEMRDDPMDAPIPKRLEPSSYSRDRVAEAKHRFSEVEMWTREQALADMDATNAASEASRRRYQAERRETKAAYERMLALVDGWTPPTADHVELKKFMREQIEGSIRFDCTEHPEPIRESHTAETWKANRLAQAAKDMAYHTEQWKQELERTNERNEWIEQLRNSLAQQHA